MDTEEREAALADVLRGRDERVLLQAQLLQRHGLPLVSFTVNMPGPVKLCAQSRYIMARGTKQLQAALRQAGMRVCYTQARESVSGPEAFFVVEAPAGALKSVTCAVENASPLGRLFDMDVLAPGDGAPLSREGAGLARRLCLICGGEASACARSRAHSVAALRARITSLVEEDKRNYEGSGEP